MELAPYVAFTSEVQTRDGVQVRVITCLANTLTQDQLGAGMDVFVFGDDITIDSALSLPACDLTIVARNITLAAGAKVDLSAPMADPIVPAKASNGDPGASSHYPDATDGEKGLPGNSGARAGSFALGAGQISGAIDIVLAGGVGSAGQDGGDGGSGLDGANGDDFKTVQVSGPPNSRENLVSQGQPGVNGGRAGNGGDGGAGGNGGDGGSFTAAALAGGEPDVWINGGHPIVGGGAQYRIQSPGGAGGTAGKGGARGARAGSGGAGGYIGVFFSESGKGGSAEGYTADGQARAGDPGDPGTDGNAGTPPSQPGAPGGFGIGTMPRFYGSRFAPPIPQLLLTLRQAEFAYLSGVTDPAQYVVAADLLLWLVTVTTPPDGSKADPDRDQILARATALIAQLNGRLDFYGQPTTHVPLASLAYYSDTLPGELASATAVETTYDTYVAAVQDQAQQRAQLNAMLDADSARLTALESQLQPLLDQITAYEAAVSVLQLARNEQGVIFANAEKVWEGAVLSQLADDAASAQCKSYEQILTTVGNVVTIEDPADLEEISVTLDVKKIDYGTIEKIGNGVIDWQNAVTRLDAAQGDIASVVDAANAIGSDALAGDSGKIAVDRAVFAEKLLPYKKIDATGELEAQLNIYLARAQAFSQKQIEYNALQIQAKNLAATIAQGRDQLTQIKNQLSEASDPTIAVYKAYMARTYGEVLDRTIRDVYGVRQAFRYWALEDFAFPPNDGVWDMAYLNGIQATLTGRVTSEINDYHGTGANNAEQFDYRTAAGAGWIIDDARSLDTLRTTGTLDFSIPIDDPWVAKNFGGMAQVVATDYTLQLHGVTVPSGDLMVRLTHNGVAQFIDPNGKPWLFTHVPVATSYRYSLGDGSWLAGGSLGNADISIGLSPFTSWRLTVLKEPDNPGLDLSGATRLVLKFAGGFRSSVQRR
ncbi:MAG: hypothetical protein JWM87_3763 [Candidatus Eremiobacteraeota bacterium]|nr:hypothetical protein [Candidatus Eremiobacteraeota bacterium]